jgi:hypothetical protein
VAVGPPIARVAWLSPFPTAIAATFVSVTASPPVI